MKDLGHTSDLYIYRSLVIRCLVVKIEHLQVTVVGVTLKKAMQTTALNNLKKIAKGPFFQVVVSVVRRKINPFNIKEGMLDHQCCIENAHLRMLV